LDFGENVHIVPLGFEIDRAVKPFERLKANRVYLLTTLDPSYPIEMRIKQGHYNKIVENFLKEKGIEVRLETDVDIFDILKVMKRVAELIRIEKSHGNDVYVNMSAAGRLTSLGASLAGMVHNAKVYYVSADGYPSTSEEKNVHGLSICNKLNLKLIENFQISMPDYMGRIVLVNLCLKGKHMRTNELVSLFVSRKIELFKDEIGKDRRKRQQSNLINLNKAVLNKLEKNGYITREKIGRLSYINITESGRYIAHVLGLKE